MEDKNEVAEADIITIEIEVTKNKRRRKKRKQNLTNLEQVLTN